MFCSTSELQGYYIYLATSIPVRRFNSKLAVSKAEPSSAHLNYSQSMSFWPSTTLPVRCLGAEGTAFTAVGTQTAPSRAVCLSTHSITAPRALLSFLSYLPFTIWVPLFLQSFCAFLSNPPKHLTLGCL